MTIGMTVTGWGMPIQDPSTVAAVDEWCLARLVETYTGLLVMPNGRRLLWMKEPSNEQPS